MTTDMRIVFVHPPLDGPPTGGTLFDREMIAAAGRTGVSLRSVSGSIDPGTKWETMAERVSDLILWDSLYLRELSSQPRPAGQARHGLLVHYLPFTNPTLSSTGRAEWAEIFNRACQQVDFLIVTGKGVAGLMQASYPNHPVFLCQPGVDPAYLNRHVTPVKLPRTGPVQLITVANLLPGKRQLELLEMLATIEAGWRWHVVGDTTMDPDYAASLNQRARVLGLHHRIVMHGTLDAAQLARLMADMDLFATCSAYESYGMAVADATAAGLPVVTTDVGEAGSIIRHGITGYVLAPGDTQQFRQALERLLHDAGLRRRFSEAAQTSQPSCWESTFAALFQQLREWVIPPSQ